ncbi:MAG: LysR substrate-binding domain-containing protein [Neisseria sp.]|uniref:LysR family transcriptional regulator n=1 Tax=Neisseria sp. TaxID=192066 RepID=UPI0026DD0403|nr:LysR family transcriptional regulator [Neisseria sp.]MDO4641261.1 LysR substrate-binding domain-containing protein [Neisseria sp.]
MQLLNDMELFVEIVKAKGFGKAAENVGMSKSTLSLRLSQLEQHIGLRLLNRTTRKIALTEAGALYYERAARIVEEAQQAHQQLDDLLNETAGLLRIALPVDLAQIFIAPLLPEFCRRYPKIRLELDLNQQKVDLISDAFDLAIRAGEQPDSGLISRVLARMSSRLYAAPAYLDKHGIPQTPDELKNHQCLRFRAGFADTWRLLNGNQVEEIKVGGDILSNSPNMNMQIALAGLGVALLPEIMSQHQTLTGKLQNILPDWQTATVPVYAITTTRLLPAKTQCFIDFLAEHFEKYQIKSLSENQ